MNTADFEAIAEMLDFYAAFIDGEKKLGVDDCHYPPIIREQARMLRAALTNARGERHG